MSRRGEGVAAAGNVRPGRSDGDVALAQQHSGERLDLEVGQGVPLCLGEASYLLLDEPQIVEDRLGDRGDHGGDLVRRHPEGLGTPVVELLRPPAYGGIAVLPYVGDHVGDGFDDFRTAGPRRIQRDGSFNDLAFR